MMFTYITEACLVAVYYRYLEMYIIIELKQLKMSKLCNRRIFYISEKNTTAVIVSNRDKPSQRDREISTYTPQWQTFPSRKTRPLSVHGRHIRSLRTSFCRRFFFTSMDVFSQKTTSFIRPWTELLDVRGRPLFNVHGRPLPGKDVICRFIDG